MIRRKPRTMGVRNGGSVTITSNTRKYFLILVSFQDCWLKREALDLYFLFIILEFFYNNMKTIFQGTNNPLMTSEKEYKIKTM